MAAATLTNLTPDNPRIDAAPQFSPDGKTVLFTRQQLPTVAGELQRLWRHNLADNRNTPLTAALDLSIDDIAFAADGRKLWLQAESQGRVPLFVMRADGSGFATGVRRRQQYGTGQRRRPAGVPA